MRWAKLVLIFQAIITLMLGMIFLAQVIVLDIAKVSELRIEVSSQNNTATEDSFIQMDLKQRYASAAYVLLFVSLMELIIIGKLLT